MSTEPEIRRSEVASFRRRLLVAMMVVVFSVAAVGLVFAQRSAAAAVRRDFERQFASEVSALGAIADMRRAVIAERCRALARRPRIHAALEDGALDLLYPSARDELADVMDRGDARSADAPAAALHAGFYRFLDARGRVITPPVGSDAGELAAHQEALLSLPRLPDSPQSGFLRLGATGQEVYELSALPIISSETGETIAAIVLGFKALVSVPVWGLDASARSGLWLDGALAMPLADPADRERLQTRVGEAVRSGGLSEGSFEAPWGGASAVVFFKRLNPESLFAPAYEVSVFSLAGSLERQRMLAWQFSGAGFLIVLGAFGASAMLSRRLAAPVERLAVDSEENRSQRHRAEAALESKQRELQQSARFSVDASHQLKTPVTVLRAGLEELLASNRLVPGDREEVASLVHQTFRISSIVEDLLLLSRMDAGRLQIQFRPFDLVRMIEGHLDDLSASPGGGGLQVEAQVATEIVASGEPRYATLVLQNVFENARKYNRPGGTIRVTAAAEGAFAVVKVGNTGRPVPVQSQEHIFERFHRGEMGEDIPGHGIGLNLARELARLHGGDLVLGVSKDDWTEFHIRFRLARSGEAESPTATP